MSSDVGSKSGGSYPWFRVIAAVTLLSMVTLVSCSSAAGEKQVTSITISISPEMPGEGIAFTITGVLNGPDESPLGNKRVVLESSPDGDTGLPFEQVAVEATDREGRFTFFRGNHTPAEYLRVVYPGNTEYSESMSEVIPVHNVSVYASGTHPSRTTGGLMLTGDPDNSLVMLDGVMRGVTPFALNGIETGPHILEIGKPGYQNQTMEIFIAPDKRTTFSFSLPPAGINLENSGIESATGLHVYQNTSYEDALSEPAGDPLFSFSQAGISVDIYGNNSSTNGTGKPQITTLYDEDPFGDGYSFSVIMTSDDTPFR